MSAWNFKAENDQVETPIAKVRDVKITAAPVLAKVFLNASVISSPSFK